MQIVETQTLSELRGARGSAEFQAADEILGPMPAGLNVLSRKNMLAEFLDRLTELGYKKINNGSFGAVFSHPGINYVVKLFKDDPAYLSFVRYANAHQENPHVPKFRGKFMKIDQSYFLVRMERLTNSFTRYETLALELLNDFANGTTSAEDFMRGLVDKPSGPMYATKVVPLIISTPTLIETIAELRAIKGSYKMDLHPGNFMKRGHEIVILDPYFVAR